MLKEYFFTCPCCWQTISMLLDLSIPSQDYIEDCEVCCRPLTIRFACEEEDILHFQATFQE